MSTNGDERPEPPGPRNTTFTNPIYDANIVQVMAHDDDDDDDSDIEL